MSSTMTCRRSSSACEPCLTPSLRRGHETEHKEGLLGAEVDFQADEAADFQEATEALGAAEISNSPNMMACHDHRLGRSE